MKTEFNLGSPIYYVPKCDSGRASYILVTRVHSALKRPLLTLGNQLVIAPKLYQTGMLARDNCGSFWISKEAFEASILSQRYAPEFAAHVRRQKRLTASKISSAVRTHLNLNPAVDGTIFA